ncbi:MAG: hypothetical protein E7353_03825 [Clostridiales bacterium]|nr:hypothetical protein [Clostridiales bacterium]
MKKILRILTSSVIALVLAVCALSGCAQTPSMTIKAPSSSSSSQSVEGGGGDVVGLQAGFELPHGSGFVDNDETQVHIYDSDYYYFNEQRSSGADPGAWYVSEADVIDSYTKLKAREEEKQGSRFNESAFISEYGDLQEWKEKYADRFYVVTTGNTSTNLTIETKQKYPTAIYGLYMLRTSKDLNDWKEVGEIDGHAIIAEQDGWYKTTPFNCWAPEFNRDPISGLYIICASTDSKSGDETTEYNPATTAFGYYQQIYDVTNLLIAVSPNPIGPYRFITAEEYYQNLAQYNEDGSVKTVTVGEGDNAKEMAIYRDDLLDDIKGDYKSGDIVHLTEYKNGEFLNLNGDPVRKTSMPLNFGYYHEKIKEAYPHWQLKDRGIWPCIDINPVVDSKGDIYMYFSQHTSSVIKGNFLWVVHMKDWITPDWDTLTHIASPSYSIIYNDGESADMQYYITHTKQADGTYVTDTMGARKAFAINGVQGYYMGAESESTVNEGTFVVEKDGWYYLTYSPFGFGSRNYSLYLAIANNPYGPFIKLPEYSPCLGLDKIEGGDYMAGSGHHSFVWAGDELYAVYHCFYNPVRNTDLQGNLLGRALGIDKVNWYNYDNKTFGDFIDEQIAKDIEEENIEDELGYKMVDDKKENNDDFKVTEEWIRARFADCNNSDYHGKDASEIYRENEVIPLPYGNGPTHSIQPLPEVALPDGLGNVMDDEDVHLELIYGKQDTLKYANDGLITYQQWSKEYEVECDDSAKQIKLKISFDNPKTIRNIMIYNSREYEYGFTQVKSIVFKLASKPTWYPENAPYNDYCYIENLKADPYGWDENNFIMRKGGGAIADFNYITVSEIVITISSDDKIDLLMGRNIVKLSEIYIMGKNA